MAPTNQSGTGLIDRALPKEEKVVLVAEKITKRFPGTVALDEVDFTVYAGAVNVLIGENGAGKSTLMKVLAGVERATSGRLLLDGSPVEIKSTRDAAHAGIGIIFQELNLYPNLSISENIFVAREMTRGGVVQHRAQEQVTAELLNRLEQPLDPATLVRDLRMGQQQIVEIAKALSQNVRILIMDEPTSALTASETEALFRIIADLRADGVAIIYISHKLEELLTIGDYVTVLRDGKLAAAAPAREINIAWIIEKMVGRNVNAPRHRSQTKASEGDPSVVGSKKSEPAPGRRRIYLRKRFFDSATGRNPGHFRIDGRRQNRVIRMPDGSASGGERRDPTRWPETAERNHSRPDRPGMMLVPEDRQRLGLIQKLSVAHNITLPTCSGS